LINLENENVKGNSGPNPENVSAENTKQNVYDEIAQTIGIIGKMHSESNDTQIMCIHALNLLKKLGA
jgi:hypothetical protein